MDRHQAAISIFQSILKQNPNNREARLGIAKALNFSGQHRSAITHFDALADTQDEGTTISMAQAYYWAGFPDVAAKN